VNGDGVPDIGGQSDACGQGSIGVVSSPPVADPVALLDPMALPDPVALLDPVVLHEWHPLSAHNEITPGRLHRTLLLGEEISYSRDIDGTEDPVVWRGAFAPAVFANAKSGSEIDLTAVTQRLPTRVKFGYVWTTLGHPGHEIFDIPECDEPDRRILNGGSLIVSVSAPRAVENFLDMGHFPYVHTGLLGIEPRTEVVEYDVETTDAQVLATDCKFYQPVAAASAAGGQVTNYTYRVPHPYCVMLYKSVHGDPNRMDVIALFNQPMTEEKIRAHSFLAMVDHVSTDNTLRHFQQLIFGQDKTILESQYPKRLPLDPRAETPIRADKSSIHYRRWLTSKGLTYGVIPAA
jgi:phenylpropionate dioxygenase-like ring-hydroxylating dioxygenase large terminal subunit